MFVITVFLLYYSNSYPQLSLSLNFKYFVHTGDSNQSDYNKIWSSSNRTRWVFKRHNHPTFIAFFTFLTRRSQYFISNFLWFTSKMRRRPQKSQTAMWLSLLVTRGVIMSTLAWFSSIWSERKDKWVLSFNSFLGTQIFYYNWKIQNNKNTLHDVRYFFKFFSMHFSWKLLMQLNFFFLQFFA